MGDPGAVIARRDAGEISDEQMLQELVEMSYTYSQFPDGGSILCDAFIPGTWQQIVYAFDAGRLTFAQYERIFMAHVDEIGQAALDQ